MNENTEEMKAPQCEEAEQPQAEKEEPQKEHKSEKGSKAAHRETAILEKKLAQSEKELAQEKDRYVRMLAEYENFRRRSQKERDAAYADACADVLSELVPMVDITI